MLKLYTIYWIVDNSTGSTVVNATCREEVVQYFEFYFAKFGYRLRSIERV